MGKSINKDRLIENIKNEHKPFITYSVETTGMMNGNDNCITQVALASYDYNKRTQQYELQDHIFMLAKPDRDRLYAIREMEIPTDENIKEKLKQNYLLEIKRRAKDNCDKMQKQIFRMSNSDKYSPAEVSEKMKDYAHLQIELEKLEKDLKENPSKFLEYNGELTNEYKFFERAKYSEIKSEMQKYIGIEKYLMTQGLDFEKYANSEEGLTTTEIQYGIMEFLKKNQNPKTVFVNLSSFFSKHYLDKENIVITDEKEKIIDLQQVERSMKSRNLGWTTNFSEFIEDYKGKTGKEITCLDALTKALCLGEMTAKATEIPMSLESRSLLDGAVKRLALDESNEYVMKLSKASQKELHMSKEKDSLEYIDFGNDRHYINVEQLFEMTEDFEITLEGEKEPIKTWEELEVKIKELNGNISKKLLDAIHDKFDRVVEEAEQRRNDLIQIRQDAYSKEYDVFLQRNEVTINPDKTYKVSYYTEEKMVGLNIEEVASLVADGVKRFNDDEAVKQERKNIEEGKRAFYPPEWNIPCRLIVVPTGELKNDSIRDEYDFQEALDKGGVQYIFGQQFEMVAKQFHEDFGIVLMPSDKDFTNFCRNVQSVQTAATEFEMLCKQLDGLNSQINDINNKKNQEPELINRRFEAKFKEEILPFMQMVSSKTDVSDFQFLIHSEKDNTKFVLTANVSDKLDIRFCKYNDPQAEIPSNSEGVVNCEKVKLENWDNFKQNIVKQLSGVITEKIRQSTSVLEQINKELEDIEEDK